ncbi:MAG: NAD(P)-dependent oxidoreductase [Methylobacteriaceae bacterium]|nr:NAD(P)-dependent oxidoreductase [Methylobacteriaceae bacterium]
MNPSLGFIGLGIMGRPMVRNLLAAGYVVHVYSIVAREIDDVVKDGAVGEANGLDVAKKADITITMVPNTPDVEKVLFGETGIIDAMGPGKTFIDMSTISALATKAFAEKIKAKGAGVLDAPVSGGEKGAIEGTLSIMVGGDAETFEKCLPVLDVMGGRITHVGGNGAGQTVKSCNQVLAAATMAAIGEALAMGTKAGVDPAKIVEVLSAGYARCGCLDIRGKNILKRDFAPGFKSKLQYKDLTLAMELARGLDVPMPIGSMVTEFYKSCMAAGGGEEDHSNVIKIAEQLAHVEIKAW